MHDSESDTFVPKTKPEQFCELLQKIGVEGHAEEINSDEVERGDYYSRYFTHSPIMITNHGCIKIKNDNIDVVQIIQKGWVGGKIVDTLNSDTELANLIIKLPVKDAQIWVDPTTNSVRIHGDWKNSTELGISKELFAVYEKIASNIKKNL